MDEKFPSWDISRDCPFTPLQLQLTQLGQGVCGSLAWGRDEEEDEEEAAGEQHSALHLPKLPAKIYARLAGLQFETLVTHL